MAPFHRDAFNSRVFKKETPPLSTLRPTCPANLLSRRKFHRRNQARQVRLNYKNNLIMQAVADACASYRSDSADASYCEATAEQCFI